jgi:putative transposase
MIKKLIARSPAFDRYSARYGRAAAERHFRSVLKSPVTSFPLERAEIDHTRLDVFVVDEETMLPLGRPWLTLCVDVHTRAILGFDLSFDPPSHMTVARCLKMALLPKGDLSTYKSVKNQWDMYGVMETLVADNGLEFHGDALEAACLSLGTNLQFCPRKQPWFKGCVERTLGTLNRGVAHGVPGTTFSNIFEKKDYDAAKHATVTLRTLREVIYLWIVDYYHQHPHKTLRDTPAHAWRAETAGMAIPLPSDAKELDAILGKIDVRCLTHKGIELNGLFYNSNEAGALARRMGTNLDVTVRYRDDNLGEIFILIPDANIYLPVRAIDYDYANGLTTWQNKVCRRFAKRQLAGRTDALALAEAKRRIRELVEADFSRKRGGTHMKSMRFKGNPPPTPAEPKQDTAPPQAPPAMSPTPVPAATPPAPVSSAPQSPFSPPAAAITKRFAAFKVDRLNPQLAAAL